MNRIPRQVAQGVYMLEIPFPPGYVPPDAMGGTTRCYLVEEEGGWLMVDCGFGEPMCFDSLCQQLSWLEVSLGEIRQLLVTHGHPDHFGLVGRLREASNVEVIMHRRDWEMAQFIIESTHESSVQQVLGWTTSLGMPQSEIGGHLELLAFGRMLFASGLDPNTLLEHDDEPVGVGQLRAILTPGHTPGHVCLYDQKRKLLFSGDHVLGEITTHVAPSFLTEEDLLGQYLASLEKVGSLDVELVLPAHSEPFAHLSRRVNEVRDHHERRLEQVLAAVRHHPSSAWQIACQVDWTVGPWADMDHTNRLLAIQETLAHLQFLHQRGQVATKENNGLTLYSLDNG